MDAPGAEAPGLGAFNVEPGWNRRGVVTFWIQLATFVSLKLTLRMLIEYPQPIFKILHLDLQRWHVGSEVHHPGATFMD